MDRHRQQVQLFRALSHPVRLRILHELRREEECVCHLSALLGKPQAYVSQQLSILREEGLLLDRKDGLRVFYRLRDPRIGDVLDASEALLVGQDGRSRQQEPTQKSRQRVVGCECPKCNPA